MQLILPDNYQKKLLEFLQRTLVIREKILSPNHSKLAFSYENVGLAWGKRGNWNEAQKFLQKALAIQEKTLPFGDPDRVITLRRIAQAYGKLGNNVKRAEYNNRADREEKGSPT